MNIPERILARYLDKSGDVQVFNNNLIVNEHGFASFTVQEDSLVILNVYGDGKYWDDYFRTQADKRNLKKVVFATRRNPKAFERKFGYRLTGYILEKEL